MRIEKQTASIFTIHEAPALDPITVILQDLGPRQGRLIIECYGEVWTAFWGGIGERTIRQFLVSCSPPYICGKMERPKSTKAQISYLMRVIEAVHVVLCMDEFISTNDEVIMPRKLTAENGAKEALIGEFAVRSHTFCHHCMGGRVGCDVCEGSGELVADVNIPWTVIKEIYNRAVKTLGRN
jgi:hypothetical protein